MIRLIALLILIACSSIALAQPQPGDSLRTVTTSGEATVYVTPDEVVVNLGVEAFAAKLEDAKSENDKASARLVAAIKGLGIAPKNLQTADMEVEIRYHNDGRPIQQIEGYYARRAYAITLTDVKLFERLIDTALQNGANRLMGFTFRTSEVRKHRDQARKLAIHAALEKAELLAGELNCRIGSPRTINEEGVSYPGYWSGRWGWAGGNSVMSQNAMQVAAGGESTGEILPLGQLAIRASIQVTFDLRP